MVTSRRFLKRALQKNRRGSLFFLLISSIIILNVTHAYDYVHRALLESVGGMLAFAEYTKSLLNTSHLYPEKAIVEGLRRENMSLRVRLAQFDALSQENAFLKKQLAFTQKLSGRTITAPVLSQPVVGESFLIQAGTHNGVKVGQPVVVMNGLVGRIESASAHTARVLPLTHVKSRVPVMNMDTREHAILVGNGSLRPHLVYAEEKEGRVDQGTFVTSSYGGGFPPGLLVGCVEPQNKGPFLEPFVPWMTLETVNVMIDFGGDAHRG
jgi:cell shape-determining protein MreC